MTNIYIVRRESADGPEMDCFTDPSLAQEWAEYIGSAVEEECIIEADTLDDMKRSWVDDDE